MFNHIEGLVHVGLGFVEGLFTTDPTVSTPTFLFVPFFSN